MYKRQGLSIFGNTTGLNVASGISTFQAITATTGTFSADATINGINVGKGANSVGSNIAIGNNALDGSVTGANNLAIGLNALTECTSGPNNVAIGNYTLDSLTTGQANTGVGYNTLQAVTTQRFNTAVGRSAAAVHGLATGAAVADLVCAIPSEPTSLCCTNLSLFKVRPTWPFCSASTCLTW